ncbi:MAG: glucose PTS transporter subunit IIA, partial [Ancrocorticia sp.]|uniref:glucose PTS transporter subunit IIA n=1 Tax=Ancrocorticia sp. TaxID=2593684 RepID=UPI003F8E60C9
VAVTEAGQMPYWNVFGLDVAQVGYQGQVIPVLFVAWILAWIEKRFHTVFSGTADFLLTPLFTMLITGFLAFVAVGPFTRILSDGLSDGILWAYTNLGPVGGLIFGLFYSPIVVTGLHQSFPAIELPLINNMAETGGSFIFPIASMANVAQGAAALAIFFIARNAKLKGLAGASSASALFGITEPAIFGVNLRLRWPFFIGMGGAALGGALVAILDIRSQALGAAGMVGFVSIVPSDIPMFLLLEVLVIVVVFAATLAYGKSRGKASLAENVSETAAEQEAEELAATEEAAEEAAVLFDPSAETDFTVTSPLEGTAIALSEVEDKTFASGMLGPGAAIVPSGGPVVSPVDGTVILAFPTGHAYGIRSASGVELLIHVGMDTVKMKGEGFTPHVKKGDMVKRGDVLVDVDWDAITGAGYQTVTPIVVSNAKKQGGIDVQEPAAVERGDLLMVIQPKEAPEPEVVAGV